ncbi:MAG TPA: glycosyltransferase family 4 protein [Gemmatimonadales bacterium]|nr:glycosyltransferase family 4 protein [Gemmatimonadales bacterium]
MRVVFLTHNYPRHAGDIAGAFLHPLATALRARGVDVRVVAPSDQGKGGEDEVDGVPVVRARYAAPERERYAYTGAMSEAIRSPEGLAALWTLHRALRHEARRVAAGSSEVVVHAHWWLPAGLAAPEDLPLVVTTHGTDVRLLDLSPARILARRVFRRAKVVTAVSRYLAARIRESTGRELTENHVQPMPVDSTGWQWSTGGEGLVVVARLTTQKRIDLVIGAAARLGIKCVIVGDGPVRTALETLARGSGASELFEFTGALPFDQVRSRLLHAGLAVLPARAEGFGLSGAEALMSGVPLVICEDGGGLLDLAGSDAVRVVPPTVDGVAGGIGDLLGSAAGRSAARTAGGQWRDRLSPPAVAERAESWYREALSA